MVQIGNILVSTDILEKKFVCDLRACRGHCCVQGDAGAPLEDHEALILEKEYRNFMEYVPETGRNTITEQGKWVFDYGTEKVTPLNNGKECAFAYFEDNICKCAIEKAWFAGKTSFRKPVSCHLYPIRVSRLGTGIALNYHNWEVCQPAVILGNRQGMPVYSFLEDALRRAYGDRFYEELVKAAKDFSNERYYD